MELSVRAFNRDRIEPPREYAKAPLVTPLDLEIGCGVGWHPVTYAKENPQRTLIAIEHTREKFRKFQHRADTHALKNLIPIHADAVRYVTHAVEPLSLDRVFILYPNPDVTSASKRWFRMPFFHELLSKLKPEGAITLATNLPDYAEEAKLYAIYWGLKLISEGHPSQPRTHFEKKYLERGETCFDLVFQKP